MANTYHQVYLQAVFAVKYRRAVLAKEWRQQVFAVIGNLVNETNCKTLIINGVEDHVHCLIGLRPAIAISELMKIVKARSSKFINDHSLTTNRFEWQEGYGVFSYSRSHVQNVYRYIQNQEAHHREQKFLDEYTVLLKENAVTFDPVYIFQQMV